MVHFQEQDILNCQTISVSVEHYVSIAVDTLMRIPKENMERFIILTMCNSLCNEIGFEIHTMFDKGEVPPYLINKESEKCLDNLKSDT